jgi:hypothetical protein
MIGHFPPPYPDELLYSIIARLAARSRFRSTKTLAQAVLGAATATAVADLPNRLSILANHIPGVMNMNDDALIDRHTLWPYFAAFQSVERRAASRREMKVDGHPYLRLGLMARRCLRTEWLKFCPLCLVSDRRSYREAYWHRTHQIPAIRSCHLHNVQLCISSVRTHCARNRHRYVCADSLPDCASSGIQLADEVDASLSSDAAWLLANPNVSLRRDLLYAMYVATLVSRGYANFKGAIRVRKLRVDFTQYFSTARLDTIMCSVLDKNDPRECWLERLLRNPVDGHYTLHHLLLIRFLNMKLSDLAQPFRTTHPFGTSPWPCLNHAASHFGAPTISNCNVSVRNNGHGLCGVFSCPDCGMVYERNGPDRGAADRIRRDHIPTYGPVWDEMLLCGWHDVTIPLRGLSRLLGVDPLTVRRQARRLGLPPTRPGSRGALPLRPVVGVCHGPIKDSKARKTMWLQLRKQLPGASTTELRRSAPAVYAFLRRYYSDWLNKYQPYRNSKICGRNRVDWSARDANLTARIGSAARRLLLVSPPVRLTRTAILREAGVVWVCGRKTELLPRTIAALSKLAEDRIGFAIRRIQLAAATAKSHGESMSTWVLIRKAGIRTDLVTIKPVQEAIKLGLASMNISTCIGGR